MYEEEMPKKKNKKKTTKNKENRFIREGKKQNEKKEETIINEETQVEVDVEKTKPVVLEEKEETDQVEDKEQKEAKETKIVKEKTTKKMIGIKTDWVSVLVKLGIFLLVAFFIIFAVTKIKNAFSGNSFTKNMEKMKEVAYIYYKVESHRPALIDEEVSMSLQSMIDATLIKELKDEKKNVCNKDYSYVSLVKTGAETYDLNVYLSCGGKSERGTYEVTYKEETETDPNPEPNEEEKPSTTPNQKITLYELSRVLATSYNYTCPSGYILAGKSCVKLNQTVIKDATPIYQITPEKNTSAVFKKSGSEYIYADPILVENKDNYVCPKGYDLVGTKCVITRDANVKKNVSYTCPNGGTPEGSKCLFTTYSTYNDQVPYCKQGSLVNGDECYVTKEPSVKCINGTKDSNRNACYTTYTASKELSDWLFDGKVTYSGSKVLNDTDTVMYEIDEELENGSIRYRKYIRKYVKVCDGDDDLVGSICKHYDKAYEERYCSGEYDMNSDKTACYTYKDADYRNVKGPTCPQGYTKKGSGNNITCYKYENAVKQETNNYYCTGKYDLTSDNKCVYSIDATLKNEDNYTCPDGYTQKGTGKNTSCYKKTTTESYYYCSNTSATLSGNRCIIPEKTEFKGYRCPSGYTLTGTKCVDDNATERINATKSQSVSSETQTIWSRTSNVTGWTWTGRTKEV